MPPRRQRTEQPASPTPERDDEQVENPETQPEVRIPIRSAAESGPSLSQPTAADVQDPAPLSEDVNMARRGERPGRILHRAVGAEVVGHRGRKETGPSEAQTCPDGSTRMGPILDATTENELSIYPAHSGVLDFSPSIVT